MTEATGDVTVIHPKFVGRPLGDCDAVTEDLSPAELPDGSVATNQGTGRWCYSDLNLAVGCTASPAACWTACSNEVMELNELHKTYDDTVDDALILWAPPSSPGSRTGRGAAYIPFPSRIPRPCRPIGPRVLRFPFPQIPTRHGQLRTRRREPWSGPPRKKRKKKHCLAARSHKTRRPKY